MKYSLDDTEIDKAYRELGGHDADSQTLSENEQELIKAVDKALDAVE